jgi:hypothetical protein
VAKRKIKAEQRAKIQYIPPKIPKMSAEQKIKLMGLLGLDMIDEIRKWTRRGLDADMQPFKPYSEIYTKIRKAAGYSTTPDMTVTGDMLNSMVVLKSSRTRFEIGFSDSGKSGRSTLIESAWGKLNKDDRSAIWAMAAAAKAKAGKGRGVSGRRSPVARTPRVQGPPVSGAPAPSNSDKAKWTNRIRPWFTLGGSNSQRYSRMLQRAVFRVEDILSGRL